MKFSTVFSLLLAGFAAASPLGRPQSSEALASREVNIEDIDNYLVTRKPDELTTEFQKTSAVHSDLQDGKYYAFEMKWPLKNGKPDDDATEEIKKAQAALGFRHVGVVVGKVEFTPKGTGKHKYTKKHFNGHFYHLVQEGDAKAKLDEFRFDLDSTFPTFRILKTGQLSYLKDISAGSYQNAKSLASAYFDDAAHQTYNAESNNCDTFTKQFTASLK